MVLWLDNRCRVTRRRAERLISLCSANRVYLATSRSCNRSVPAWFASAGFPERELGEFRFAPGSTPTPWRSTSSPPSQPVTASSTIPIICSTIGKPAGELPGIPRRSNQTTAKSTILRILPPPCQRPMVLARVPAGIAIQSITPGADSTAKMQRMRHTQGFSAQPLIVNPWPLNLIFRLRVG